MEEEISGVDGKEQGNVVDQVLSTNLKMGRFRPEQETTVSFPGPPEVESFDLPTFPSYSKHTSEYVGNYISDPAPVPRLNPLAADFVVRRKSRQQLTKRLAACLTSRSNARIWGKSALKRLEYEGPLPSFLASFLCSEEGNALNLQLLACLGVYLPFGAEIKRLVHPALNEAMDETMQDIGSYLSDEMMSGGSATEPLAEDGCVESTTTTSRADEGHLREVLDLADQLISRDAFDSLSLRVRENLYSAPNHFRAARRLPTYIAYGTPGEILIETSPTLLKYIKQNFPGRQVDLSTLVTITGTAFYAYATTCLDYLKKTWPDTGHMLLPVLQDATQKALEQPGSTTEAFGGMSLHVIYSRASVAYNSVVHNDL